MPITPNMALMSDTNSQLLTKKIGVFLFNSYSQCGYQYVPTLMAEKLVKVPTLTRAHNAVTTSNGDHQLSAARFEKIYETLCEMIFGSVALNLSVLSDCETTANESHSASTSPVLMSKMHKLCPDLLMTSFIFQCDYSNGKTLHRKYGLAIVWDVSEDETCDSNGYKHAMVKQFILNEASIFDAIVADLVNDLVRSRMKTPKEVHRCVVSAVKTIAQHLSVCRLTSNLNDDQFIDELASVIDPLDCKSTRFFISTLLSAILMFRHKYVENRNSLKIVLWTQNSNKVSQISQLLLVINKFLIVNSVTKTKQMIAQSSSQKAIKFCRKLRRSVSHCNHITPNGSSCCDTSLMTATMTANANKGLSRNSICERKSRDESLGYESLTESCSTATSTICESGDFGASMTATNFFANRTSTPLPHDEEANTRHQLLESGEYYTQSDSNNSSVVIDNSDTDLQKSENYFREYRNLRFTSCPTSGNNNCSAYGDQIICANMAHVSVSDDCDDFESATNNGTLKSAESNVVDVELIGESKLVRGFGECSMPQVLSAGHMRAAAATPQSPAISNTYLMHAPMQAIVNCKSIANYDELLNDCSHRLSASIANANNTTVILSDCDSWRVNIVEANGTRLSATMSSAVGNLCETVAKLHSLRMKTSFIHTFLSQKLDELKLKSLLLKSVIDINSRNNMNLIKRCFDNNSCSLSELISENLADCLSPADCALIGFDISDIPLIIAMKREIVINNKIINMNKNIHYNSGDFRENRNAIETKL